MNYGEMITHIADHGGPSDRDAAKKVTQIVLADLGQRLTGDEAKDLASQLPEEVKAAVTEHVAAEPVADDVDPFLRRVADHLGSEVDPEQARAYVQAVFSTLAQAVSEGQYNHLRSQLPAGFGPLFT